MRLLRLWGLFVRLRLLHELAYRAHFFASLFQAAFGMGLTLLAVQIVYAHTSTLAGWRAAELRVLVGIFVLVGGTIHFAIRPAMERLMKDIQDGSLDFVLTKPEDAQVLVSARDSAIGHLADLALGGILIAVSLEEANPAWTGFHALMFFVSLMSGLAVVYGFLLMLAATSFWVVNSGNILMVFIGALEAGRWPLEIYPAGLRWALTFVAPVAFAVTVPAQALVGRLELGSLAPTLGAALLSLLAARGVWRLGLRRYSGASG